MKLPTAELWGISWFLVCCCSSYRLFPTAAELRGIPIKSNSQLDQILFLQRTIGNQAVQRLLQSGTQQAKLKMGKPGDSYEQEADRVAEQVMRMPAPQVSGIHEVAPEVESRINAIPGGGQPLPEHVHAFFKLRFGHDFGQVRVEKHSEPSIMIPI